MKHCCGKNSITGKVQSINSFWLYFVPFIVLSVPVLIWILTDNMPVVDGYYSMHYLLTYDHGFVGRGLVGEILSWFFDVLTLRTISIINVAFTEVLVVAVSLCIGKVLNNSRKNTDIFSVVVFSLLILCFGEFTVGAFYSDIKMEKLILALTLFSILVSDKKYLCFLIPVFSIVSVLINPVFCFTYFVLIIVVLFDKFQKSSYSFKSGFLLISTCVTVVLIIVYAAIAERQLGFNDENEFLDFYFRRLEGGISQELREGFVNQWLFEYFDSPINILKNTFRTYFIGSNSGAYTLISTVFLAVPSIALMSFIWSKVIRVEENKFRKFTYLICILAFIPNVVAVIMSWESTKYYGNYLFVQLLLLVYFLNNNDNSVVFTVNKIKSKTKTYPLAAASVIGYFLTVLMVK